MRAFMGDLLKALHRRGAGATPVWTDVLQSADGSRAIPGGVDSTCGGVDSTRGRTAAAPGRQRGAKTDHNRACRGFGEGGEGGGDGAGDARADADVAEV